MKVNDKVIVVTGGGGGLGQALVLNLLRTGARVAAVDINEEALKETRKATPVVKTGISPSMCWTLQIRLKYYPFRKK